MKLISNPVKKSYFFPIKIYNFIYFSLFFLLIAFCCSCAKKPHHSLSPGEQPAIQDLAEFPQNLEPFAINFSPNKRLLSDLEQRKLFDSFLNIFYSPWGVRKAATKVRDIKPFFRKARGYKLNGVKWTQTEWDAMASNASLNSFPNRAQAGITVRQTNLREMPANEARFTEPVINIKDNPFDYFQYSILWPGMPLFIAHQSLDKAWYYVECPIAGGWVNARDIAFVNDEFKSIYRQKDMAALIRDKIALPAPSSNIGTSSASSKITGGIGATFPLAEPVEDGILNIYFPIKNNSDYAEVIEISLSPNDAVKMPLPFTPMNMAKIGNVLMGQSYGWGGTNGDRDCSALMRDIFAPFGIWLPRNSRTQAARGSVISLKGLDAEEKSLKIIRDGIPFISLLGLPGHIALYVGVWHGKPAIYHNAWGVRIIKDGNDDERCVIGKTVITSINPGIELENLYRLRTFADRINTLSNPGVKPGHIR